MTYNGKQDKSHLGLNTGVTDSLHISGNVHDSSANLHHLQLVVKSSTADNNKAALLICAELMTIYHPFYFSFFPDS